MVNSPIWSQLSPSSWRLMIRGVSASAWGMSCMAFLKTGRLARSRVPLPLWRRPAGRDLVVVSQAAFCAAIAHRRRLQPTAVDGVNLRNVFMEDQGKPGTALAAGRNPGLVGRNRRMMSGTSMSSPCKWHVSPSRFRHPGIGIDPMLQKSATKRLRRVGIRRAAGR